MGVWETEPALRGPTDGAVRFCQYITFDEKLGEIKPLPRGQL